MSIRKGERLQISKAFIGARGGTGYSNNTSIQGPSEPSFGGWFTPRGFTWCWEDAPTTFEHRNIHYFRVTFWCFWSCESSNPDPTGAAGGVSPWQEFFFTCQRGISATWMCILDVLQLLPLCTSSRSMTLLLPFLLLLTILDILNSSGSSDGTGHCFSSHYRSPCSCTRIEHRIEHINRRGSN